jgi:hypothetical protein
MLTPEGERCPPAQTLAPGMEQYHLESWQLTLHTRCLLLIGESGEAFEVSLFLFR